VALLTCPAFSDQLKPENFGSLEPADVKRLRQLEQENGRLKKMVADRENRQDS
jgi:hypothetical protein